MLSTIVKKRANRQSVQPLLSTLTLIISSKWGSNSLKKQANGLAYLVFSCTVKFSRTAAGVDVMIIALRGAIPSEHLQTGKLNEFGVKKS